MHLNVSPLDSTLSQVNAIYLLVPLNVQAPLSDGICLVMLDCHQCNRALNFRERQEAATNRTAEKKTLKPLNNDKAVPSRRSKYTYLSSSKILRFWFLFLVYPAIGHGLKNLIFTAKYRASAALGVIHAPERRPTTAIGKVLVMRKS